MRENRSYGSVRGAARKGGPYRDRTLARDVNDLAKCYRTLLCRPRARRQWCRVGWGLPMLQADVRVLCLPPGFPAVPQYPGHTSVVPQPLSEPCLRY